MAAIQWGKRSRPRKADQGHSAVQYGWAEHNSGYGPGWAGRSYIRCECGKRLSGMGGQGGYYSWRRHQARERAKCEEAALA